MGQTEKSEKIYAAITELPDEYILEAEEYAAPGKIQNPYLKWTLAAAACLVIFCSGMISGLWLAENRQQGGLTQTKHEEEKESFQFLVHNMAMNNASSTNVSPSDAVYSNYLNFSTKSCTEIADLYQLYGMTSGDEIEKIVYSKGNRDAKTITITEEEARREFYQLTMGLERYSANQFFVKVIDKLSEKEIAAFHEECRILEVTTTNGLVFVYSIYPESEWLYCGGTMSYYALSEELLDWHETYCSE